MGYSKGEKIIPLTSPASRVIAQFKELILSKKKKDMVKIHRNYDVMHFIRICIHFVKMSKNSFTLKLLD